MQKQFKKYTTIGVSKETRLFLLTEKHRFGFKSIEEYLINKLKIPVKNIGTFFNLKYEDEVVKK